MAITNPNNAMMTNGGYPYVYAGGGGGGSGAIGGPVAGQMRINSATGQAEAWTGHTWAPITSVNSNPSEEDLKDGAWAATISQLGDLWTVRFGSGWVGESELDDFYRIAKVRLEGLHKIEKVQGAKATVYRIVE